MASGWWAVALSLSALGCVQQAALSPPLALTPNTVDVAGAVPGNATRYLLRRAGSSVKVFALDVATGRHTLVFPDFHGLLAVDDLTTAGTLTLFVDMRTVKAGNSMVTEIVRDELLQADTHPRARIKAALSPGGDPDERVVQGTMLLHGVERGIRFTGTLKREGEGYRFATVFNLSRSAFGIQRGPRLDWMIFDDFRVEFDLLATPERVKVEVLGT